MEEFRAPVADALMLQLTGWRALRPEDFRTGDRGVRMRPAARRRFLEGYEYKLVQPFQALSGAPTTLRDEVREQAHRLAEAIRTGERYVPFELP